MEITINPTVFSSELYKLLGVTGSKGPLTVVANALLTANADNTVTLEATDLELSIATQLECNVKTPGQLCLNAHNLYNVIKGLTTSEATIVALENSWAQLKSGDVDCRIVGVPPVEFPRLPEIDEISFISIDADDMFSMIDRTIFSVSTDEARPNLMGAYLITQGEQVLMVSTDGHRLSKVIRSIGSGQAVGEELQKGILIPRKSLAELKRAIDKSVSEVRLGVSGNNAVFQLGVTSLMVRIVDATFPDYQRVVPAELPERQALVDVKEFFQKLKFVSLFSSPRTHNVSVAIEGELLELTASDPDMGEGKETMTVQYTGPKVQVGYNSRYLTDVLGVLEEPKLRLQIVDAFSASLILDGEQEDDLFLIMPMRI